MRIGLPTKTGRGRSVPLSPERLVNMFAEAAPDGAKSHAVLHGSPGWVDFTNLQTFVDRDFSNISSDTLIDADATYGTSQVKQIVLSPDGTRMYLLTEPKLVNEFTLSTAWDLDTATATGNTQTVQSDGNTLYMKPDGTRFWIGRTSGNQDLHQWTMTTAWDLSTAVDDGVLFAPGIGAIFAIQFSSTGDKMYLMGALPVDTIHQYKLSSNWGITTAVADGNTLTTTGDSNFWITSDGLEMYSADDDTTIDTQLNKRTLSTPFDISTAGAEEFVAFLTRIGQTTYSIFMPDDQPYLFLSHGLGHIERYTFSLSEGIDSGKKQIRGLHVTPADGILYVAVGTSLYSIDASGGKSLLGTIAGYGRVGMADNGKQLCIVTGALGYTYSVMDGLEQITDSDFDGANTVTFMDGFFIFNSVRNGRKDRFFISNLLDGIMYDALDFATAERYPDSLVRVFADHSQLLLFGSETLEVWYNAGAEFPFAPAQGSAIEQGLGARWSVVKIDESVMWLDNEGSVRRLQGLTPVRISTHAEEYAFKQGDWTNAYAWSYVDEGHHFYVLTIPAKTITEKASTHVYDAATGLWAERKSYELDYLKLGFHAYAYGKHIVGDTTAGKLYDMSLDTYTEGSDHLVSEMHFPQVQNDGDRFIVHKLQLDMEVGAIETSGEQNVMLDVSGNTRTFDMTQPWRSAGKKGEYEQRVIWRQLGQHRSFSPKVSISVAAKRAIYASYAEIEPCRG